MFATNWPVDRLFSSYGDVVNAYREIAAELPTSRAVVPPRGAAACPLPMGVELLRVVSTG